MDEITLNQAEEKLSEHLVLTLSGFLINENKRRISTSGTRLQLWVRSTPKKDAFGLCMVKAAITNTPFRISEIVNHTEISRQSVSLMVKDWVAEGWIRVFSGQTEIKKSEIQKHNGRLGYMAEKEVVSLAMDYSKVYLANFYRSGLDDEYKKLLALEELRLHY